ncbi:hypothetical protein GCM10010282_36850 [Streptomyces roseolus]|nr:hypothetical protein GCM10010282_36850 [Streptomyces roseolus]
MVPAALHGERFAEAVPGSPRGGVETVGMAVARGVGPRGHRTGRGPAPYVPGRGDDRLSYRDGER